MNVDDLMVKMNEILTETKAVRAEAIELRVNVESLQRQVDDLRERLTHRERVLVGWKEISQYLGYADTSGARRLASEDFDPLPVLRDGHVVVAFATALDAYKERKRAIAGQKRVTRYIPRESGETPS